VEAIPFFGFDASNNGVVRPFFRNDLPRRDGDEKTGFSALMIEGCRDCTGVDPFIRIGRDVLGTVRKIST
jgi:hypothetical protein